MRPKFLVLIIIIVLCGLAVSYDFWPQQRVQIAPPAAHTAHFETVPDLTFTTRDQKTYQLKTLSEPGILLHFWASWCAPCQTEFPQLLKQIAEANGRLALVAVSIDESPAAITHFMAQYHLTSAPHVYWVWDQGKIISLKTFNTAAVPETILINRQRRMVEKLVGDPDWTSAATSQRLKTLLANDDHPL